MIAKIKKSSAGVKKKEAKVVKKVKKAPKKSIKVEAVPEIKEEPTEAPKKLKGISKRFNVEKPAKKPKIKKEVKAEETPGVAAKTPADVKPLRKGKPNTFGVVQIKCLPHGFFEEQLREFFSQFGAVHRVRVKRSLKTGKSTGVGFVEFRVAEVAEIAAQTMNNYLLMKNILKTKYIPPDKVTPNIMKSRVKVKVIDGQEVVLSSTMARQRKAIEVYNAQPTEEAIKKRQERFEKKLEAKKRKLAEAGISFDVEKVIKRTKKKVTESLPEKKTPEEVAVESEEEEDGEDSAEEVAPPPKKASVAKKASKAKKLKEKPEKFEKLQKKVTKKKKTPELSPPKAAPVAPKKPKKKESVSKENKKGSKVLKMGQKKSKKLVKK
ncbi:MKI67 FHA domain-interacting nucleolar phosphoprotein-like [Lutzomyia longipalpis]|uniref:MKI67 FHA domain-interacting nucleolar phosphoprotein-like n=1 Tax=Lutzomyia longipalpis TaxID=7200 RepID=UPI0024833454|nr:MKI67 FHA domain-interacting nucleolar phosphoprotein-like [Lutzomyia longipalpis]